VYARAPEADNSIPLARLLRVLRRRSAGLVTDVDGTISPIVARPADARVLPAARDALARLSQRLALVAVVSGRRAADARRLVGLPELVYVGNHGLEMLTAGQDERDLTLAPAVQPWLPVIAQAARQLAARLEPGGMTVEAKGASAAVHYRGLADVDRARRLALAAAGACAQAMGLWYEEGRMVVNLLPPLPIDKGSAVRWLADERRLAGLAYCGDDLTDAHAFAALATMRRLEQRETVSVAVVGPETPPRVRALADTTVGSVADVASLLQAVADALAVDDA